MSWEIGEHIFADQVVDELIEAAREIDPLLATELEEILCCGNYVEEG